MIQKVVVYIIPQPYEWRQATLILWDTLDHSANIMPNLFTQMLHTKQIPQQFAGFAYVYIESAEKVN